MTSRTTFETERFTNAAEGDTAFRTAPPGHWATQEATCEVSFVIVSWNAKRYLQECLTSLRKAATGLDYEVIVIDNCSNDGSPEMVREEFREVRLLQNVTNAGFAQANNQGIRIARGRYLCLVNSDVHTYPETIRNFLKYMDGNPDVGIAGPRALNGDGSRQPTCRTMPTLRSSLFRALSLDTCFPNSKLFGSHFMTNWNYEETKAVDILGGCFWMVRRRAVEKVGLLDTRFFMYGEDMDFCRRFHAAGWKVMFYPGAQITHYGGGSSGNAPARFWVEMQRANLQYWIKHRPHAKVIAYCLILVLHHAIRVAGLLPLCVLRKKESTRTNLAKNWRGLKWLLSPSTISAVIRRNVKRIEGNHGK